MVWGYGMADKLDLALGFVIEVAISELIGDSW
jgi:hypothetical protein